MLLIILLFVVAGVFWRLNEFFDTSILGFISLIIFIIAALFSVVAIGSQATSEQYYQEALYEKEILEYRLEHVDRIGNENLYRDILEFNKMLRENKYKANSIWVGSLYNKKIATIDYIEIIKD